MNTTLLKRRIFVSIVLIFGILVGTVLVAAQDGIITACVNGENGNTRIVASSADCREPEYSIQWNISGPAGLPGPAGTNGTNGQDGATGPQGPAGFSALAVLTPESVNCVNGGQRIDIGLDNGDNGGVPYNGLLEAGEIDTTAYLCNGAQGPAGLQGPQGLTGLQGPAGLACWDTDGNGVYTLGEDRDLNGLLDANDCQGLPGNLALAGQSCPSGQFITGFDANGDLVCGVPMGSGSGPLTVDSAEDVGRYTSIAIGVDDLPIISYYDATNGDLKIARCNNLTCSSTTITTLDSADDVGWNTSIAIGADDLPVISYYDVTNGDLKVAHCNNAVCSSTTITTLDSTGNVGWYTSIAIGADDLPIISYYDATNHTFDGELKVAHCNDVACSSAALTTLDSTGNVGQYTSIAMGTDGLPIISYYDKTNGLLKVAHCNDVACSSASVAGYTHFDDHTTGSSGGVEVGQHTSIATTSDGLAVISYYDVTNGDLRVANCTNEVCPTHTALDGAPEGGLLTYGENVGWYTAIAIGVDGLPIISYYDVTNGNLKVSHCNNVTCSSVSLTALDTGDNIGQYTAIAIGADGLPVISYFDFTNGDLKVAHCNNVACTP